MIFLSFIGLYYIDTIRYSLSMFIALLIKVLPLYLMIAIGWFAGRYAEVSDKQIADFTIHFIAPPVLFCMAWQTDLDIGTSFAFILTLTLLTLFMAGTSYLYGKKLWGDKRKNLFSHQILGSNTGYFGIPVVFALFSEQTANAWVLVMMVSTILHTSLGYWILATGNLSPMDGLKRLLKLPLFWAMVIGLAFGFGGIPWVDGLEETLSMFKGAYFVLGMAIIGLSMAKISRVHFDFNYIWNAALWRFPVWSLAAFAIVLADIWFFDVLPSDYRAFIILYAAMPLPANSVAYAAQLNVHPQKAASAVLATTLIALAYIPAIMMFYQSQFGY